MRSQTIVGGGGTPLHVIDTGNPRGRSIIFIHGFSQCSLAWNRQLSSDLGNDYRLIAMDLRGHGLSGRPQEYSQSQLWADDVHGAWIPFTKPTDEEIVWVGYDSTKAPSEVWTYWHGKVLHADWRDRGPVAIDVQWGKHGSMPRGIVDDANMWPRTLTNFWVSAWIGLPDIWLGRLSRPGPLCFCHGYRRYRTFDRPIIAGERIDVVVRAEDPDTVLSAVFGRPYSKKTPWP